LRALAVLVPTTRADQHVDDTRTHSVARQPRRGSGGGLERAVHPGGRRGDCAAATQVTLDDFSEDVRHVVLDAQIPLLLRIAAEGVELPVARRDAICPSRIQRLSCDEQLAVAHLGAAQMKKAAGAPAKGARS